jgi:hypothetical protein
MKESIKGNRTSKFKSYTSKPGVGHYNKENNKLIRLLMIKTFLKNQESQLSRHLPLLGTTTSQTILHDSVGFE